MKGPCAKRRVVCEIWTCDGRVFVGENSCDQAQKVCPRAAGEGYEKCKSICGQAGHAVAEALAAARAAKASTYGATVRLWGHYWICEPCGRALLEADIHDIIIDSCGYPHGDGKGRAR